MSVIKFAINGYGRIGRNVLRAFFEGNYTDTLTCVGINDLGDSNTLAHLTQYDTTHGTFRSKVGTSGNNLVIEGHTIPVFSERNPEKLPWKDLGVDVVFECTGLFTSRDKAKMHINAGAKKVIISAPATDVDATIVYGVNHGEIKKSDQIISNASCTTNCLANFVAPLHEQLNIQSGLMTTIHAYTNDQVLCDVYHNDLRRARSATQSMIPAKTGAAAAIGLVLPSLAGKLDGFAIRVPTLNVSIVDLSFIVDRNSTVEEVHSILTKRADGRVLKISGEQLVSCDFNHNSASAIVDTTLTKVKNNHIKVCAWYDNEWGFSNRMLDVALLLG
ncbi:MAG: type I glyceraldehyde-3-phosphate dehydrogenase [Methylacidiphilales bacterium]|nr:type I glyceraldehyde-3-phosphate dehydrogenase [Candidatus Methylacidiphilales bacterium]